MVLPSGMEKEDTDRDAPSFWDAEERGGKGGGAGAGGEGDHHRGGEALEEAAGGKSGDLYAGEVDDEDLKDTGEIHDEHELDERQKHAEAVHTYGVGHEAEHADGRVQHNEARDLDHDVGRAVKEVEHLLALVADDAEAEAEEPGRRR